MVQKEVEDYVKTQRSLGVHDHDIKRSLLDAGHQEHEIAHHFTKQVKKRKFDLKLENKHLLFMNIFTVIIFAALFLNMNAKYSEQLHNLSAVQEEQIELINTKIDSQTGTLQSQLSSTSSSLQFDIDSTKKQVTTLDSKIKSDLQGYNYDSLIRDSALSESIQKIANTSLSELSDFEQQLEIFRGTSVDFSTVIPKAIEAVVSIGKKGTGFFSSTGSGVFVHEDGYIVTNYHVVDDLIGGIDVRTHNGNDYSATLVGKDDHLDIAVLKLSTERKGFPALKWADSDKVIVGEHIIAVGNPVGFESTVTQGIISNTRRLIPGDIDVYYFQTDVAINAGNSGGPLINKKGEIVGIATLKYAQLGVEGLSFALRSNDVQGKVLNIITGT
ncbi:MAG: trypsin-like peptidase domain-containing protein [Candidatus Woesearchaeota archaeon]